MSMSLSSPLQLAKAQGRCTAAVQGLCKKFGHKSVIDGFSHHFEEGAHALLGANGVGKSTLLALMGGAIDPDAGDIQIAGHPLGADGLAARSCLGYMPGRAQLYPFMSGADLLAMVCAAKGLPRDAGHGLIEGFRLESFLSQELASLSEGTLRKWCVVSALVGDPAVVLLDEPTSGLDDASITFLGSELSRRAKERCVIFATHDRAFSAQLGAKELTLPWRQSASSKPSA